MPNAATLAPNPCAHTAAVRRHETINLHPARWRRRAEIGAWIIPTPSGVRCSSWRRAAAHSRRRAVKCFPNRRVPRRAQDAGLS